jgi:hypothetical protein
MKRRRVLLTIAGLGSMVALLGLVGLIAPFTDRATTGRTRSSPERRTVQSVQ